MNVKTTQRTLLTYAQAAEELQVSKSTIIRLCVEGKLSVHIMGPRLHRVDGASLVAFLSETLKRIEPVTCRYGKITRRPGVVTLGGELPYKEALELAQKLTKQKRDEMRKSLRGVSPT